MQVKLEAQRNKIFSTWERDRKEELERLRRSLTLQPLYKQPPPAWAHPSLLAEFGDAYLEATGLGSADIASSIGVLSLVMERIVLSDGHGIFAQLGHDAIQVTTTLSIIRT